MGGIGFAPILQAATSLAGAFAGGGQPSAPAVQQAPAAPTIDSGEVKAKQAAERDRLLKQRGLGSTRVTGPLGLQSGEDEKENEVKLQKKTLLGE